MPVTLGHYYTAKMNLFSPKNAALSPKMILFFLYLSKNALLAQVRPASRDPYFELLSHTPLSGKIIAYIRMKVPQSPLTFISN